MSMSAFQNTAPFAPQTATVADAASPSVLYLPLEIWLQVATFAISWSAVGPAPPPPVLVVVTDAAVDAAETFPAASLALTVKEYVVPAVKPLTVADVPA